MKRTNDDDNFAVLFASRLFECYRSAKKTGVTDQEFADSIGVARAQLDRYLAGGPMPSVRTVVLAFQKYGIVAPYRGVSVGELVTTVRRKTNERKPNQLSLPFTISTEGPSNVEVKLRPVSTRKFELRLTVKRPA